MSIHVPLNQKEESRAINKNTKWNLNQLEKQLIPIKGPDIINFNFSDLFIYPTSRSSQHKCPDSEKYNMTECLYTYLSLYLKLFLHWEGMTSC